MHKESVMTQRLLFVNVLALVSPSPVQLCDRKCAVALSQPNPVRWVQFLRTNLGSIDSPGCVCDIVHIILR